MVTLHNARGLLRPLDKRLGRLSEVSELLGAHVASRRVAAQVATLLDILQVLLGGHGLAEILRRRTDDRVGEARVGRNAVLRGGGCAQASRAPHFTIFLGRGRRPSL